MLLRNRVDVGGARQGDSEGVLCVWGEYGRGQRMVNERDIDLAVAAYQ